ncbi:MAG: retron Ec67 family RNA-directed DNA polymerase/endonuclease [Gammaproteobacteria bacterium]|nr:retron Ec67 family RNA-directed DNA polymerase/endonuclease [Gammaproteobacteria bacterium]
MTTTPTTLELLQAAKSRPGLAKLLQIEHSQLTYILYKKSDAEKYKTFEIPKRGGGLRTISAPIAELKLLQRRLGDVLYMCAVNVENSTGRINYSAHGFKPDRSILTNAAVHRNKRFVFNVDLKDFFPTISAKRIRGYLINDKYYRVVPEVATTIAHIASRDGILAQGAPSSPVISNLIAGILDFHLTRLAKSCGCRYTRYADDITFSTNKKEFPKEIARLVAGAEHNWEPGGALVRLIKKSGFEINGDKTRMQYKNSRQQVTGLVVNKKLNVTQEYRKLARAYVFSLITHGKYTVTKFTKNTLGNIEKEVIEGTFAQLHGMLGFIHSVDNVFRADRKNNPYNYVGYGGEGKNGDQKLQIFRRFLYYTNFYCNSAPLIVCEGKTDNAYISNAVHQSKALFPQLLKKGDEDNDVLSFFFDEI